MTTERADLPSAAPACDPPPDGPLFAHQAPHPQSSPCGQFLVVEAAAADGAEPSEGGGE